MVAYRFLEARTQVQVGRMDIIELVAEAEVVTRSCAPRVRPGKSRKSGGYGIG